MKRVIAILGVLIFLAGCLGPLTPQPGPLISLLGGPGVINRPRVSGTDDWYVQPGAKEWLDFSTGRDSYGHPTGLSDDSRWTIREVHIKLAEKDTEDTVFWPGRGAPVYDNSCVWFPGWTAPIEPISGLPYPLYPLEGYPWSPCLDLHSAEAQRYRNELLNNVLENHPQAQNEETRLAMFVEEWAEKWNVGICAPKSLYQGPSQVATITATAEADWIEVEIIVPDQGGGWYSLDIPGYTPTSSNVLRIRIDRPGDIGVSWTDGERTRTWTVTVPVDWFWATATFEIPVGPSGVCR